MTDVTVLPNGMIKDLRWRFDGQPLLEKNISLGKVPVVTGEVLGKMASCSSCGRLMSLRKDGAVHAHGPKGRPCPGSYLSPAGA